MSPIVDDTPERSRARAAEVESKLDAIARHVAAERRRAAEQSRLIAILAGRAAA